MWEASEQHTDNTALSESVEGRKKTELALADFSKKCRPNQSYFYEVYEMGRAPVAEIKWSQLKSGGQSAFAVGKWECPRRYRAQARTPGPIVVEKTPTPAQEPTPDTTDQATDPGDGGWVTQ